MLEKGRGEASRNGELHGFKDQVASSTLSARLSGRSSTLRSLTASCHYGLSENTATDNMADDAVLVVADPISSIPHAEAVIFHESVFRRQGKHRNYVICVVVVLIGLLSPILIVTLKKPGVHPSGNETSDTEPTILLQSQQSKLFSNDIAHQDRFGSAVAIKGDLMVVGAPLANSTYIFRRQRGIWMQEAKLTGLGRFGRNVAIVSNFTVVVSAYYDDHAGPYSGSVSVFEQSGDNWKEQARLIASDASSDSLFGIALAVDESTIVIAAQNSNNRTGCVYVFIKNVDNDWIELQKLTASNAATETYFGSSVAMSNDILVVGAKAGDDIERNSGAVYVFERSSESPMWTEFQTLIGSDSINGDEFGRAVAIENNTMAIGATGNDDDGSDSGNVYVYERNGQNMWIEQSKIAKPNPYEFAQFGSSIVLLNGRLLISSHYGKGDESSGEVFMFIREGSNWRAEFQLIASGQDKKMDRPQIAADGDTIAVGCGYSDTSKGARSGIVFMYRFLSR